MNLETGDASRALRALPEARSAALALPRFLLRVPYGRRTEPVEAFEFEELTGGSNHEKYLWGNPAILCGQLLASTFQAEGWDMQTGVSGEIDGLPLHSFTEDGECKAKPCAEAWLSGRASQLLLNQGLTRSFPSKAATPSEWCNSFRLPAGASRHLDRDATFPTRRPVGSIPGSYRGPKL
jgi:predicted component of type VI protein secretion system